MTKEHHKVQINKINRTGRTWKVRVDRVNDYETVCLTHRVRNYSQFHWKLRWTKKGAERLVRDVVRRDTRRLERIAKKRAAAEAVEPVTYSVPIDEGGEELPAFLAVNQPKPKPETVGTIKMRRKEAWIKPSSYQSTTLYREKPDNVHGLEEVYLSQLDDGSGLHAPCFDLDLSCSLVPSKTAGHYHLYIDKAITWDKYLAILEAFVDAGIVEAAYLSASKKDGVTVLRKPSVEHEFEQIKKQIASGQSLLLDSVGTDG